MKLTLSCRDVGVDCDVIFEGETEEEVINKAQEHAAQEHNLPEIPPTLKEKCLASIRKKGE